MHNAVFSRRSFLSAAAALPSIRAGQEIPDLNDVKPDLELPAVTDGEPAPGRRVRQSNPEYAATAIRHLLYLPSDWKPGRRYPVIVEYAGNGHYSNQFGDTSSGEVEGSKLGYGISGGNRFIWLSVPYVNQEHTANEKIWWGDVEATIRYVRETVRSVCQGYSGDPSAIILAGFSRGAIACNYIGLHDDEIADLWLAFIPFSHYDGAITRWPYEGASRDAAISRLKRLKGRAVFVCNERSTEPGHSIAATKAFIESTGIQAPFTYQEIPFRNHNSAWVLRDIPARWAARQWLDYVLAKSQELKAKS
jgi:hypothetical protein